MTAYRRVPLIALTIALSACSNKTPRNAESSAAAASSSPPGSSSSSAEQPSGSLTLPLQEGRYVTVGTACEGPPNAQVRWFDGKGLSGSSTRDCRAEIQSRDGDVFSVNESCVNTYDGKRTSEAQQIAVSGKTAFTLTAGSKTTAFSYCPDAKAPAPAPSADTPIDSKHYAEVMAARSREYEAAEWKKITLTGYRCGDNCYVEFIPNVEGGGDETAMCSADICGGWERAGQLPSALKNKVAEVKYGVAPRIDGSGRKVDSRRNIVALRFAK